MISEYRLRCSACGAAYAALTTSEILTCSYCGTSQRMVDARQFLDHFLAQVTAFVRQAVPVGLDVASAANVDPIARLTAFNAGIRPRVRTESEQFRAQCFQLLAFPQALRPFAVMPPPRAGLDPSKASVFAAEVQSVSALAVDEASRSVLTRAGGVATAYQSLFVAARLASGRLPERYGLIAKDFGVAAEALASVGEWPAIVARLQGLRLESEAVTELLAGAPPVAIRTLLAQAESQLGQARTMLRTLPDLGYMLTAVDQEIRTTRAVGTMLGLVEVSPQVAPAPLLYLERLTTVLEFLGQQAPPEWASTFRSAVYQEEIFRRATELRAAQAGRGTVRAVVGPMGTYVPFWSLELPYTFETGALWKRTGKEVPELLLVAATFPTDLSSVGVEGVSRVLTDVFARPLAGGLDGFVGRVSGSESRISDSGSLEGVLRGAADVSLGGRPAVPPFGTSAEAVRLVQIYLERVRAMNPRIATQLRASSPRVREIVYLPCDLGGPVPVPWLGALTPLSLGPPATLGGFVS